jgi:hypothetical protein
VTNLIVSCSLRITARMNLEELLERARENLPEREVIRYQRVFNREKMEGLKRAIPVDTSSKTIILLQLKRKEHELELLKRKRGLDEKIALFEKKRLSITTERNARFGKQQSDRQKRISEIKTSMKAKFEDFEDRLDLKLTTAFLKRHQFRQDIVRRIHADRKSRREMFEQRQLGHSPELSPRTSSRAKRSSPCKQSLVPSDNRVAETRKLKRDAEADAAAARLSMLNDKLKAREDLVARNKAEIKRALADNVRKHDEKSSKNLRNAREEAAARQASDFEAYKAKHISKNRFTFRAETRKGLLDAFLKQRLLYATKVRQNRERIKGSKTLMHELRMREMSFNNPYFHNYDTDVTDAYRRLNRIKTKEFRKRFIKRINEVVDYEELQKLRGKLTKV